MKPEPRQFYDIKPEPEVFHTSKEPGNTGTLLHILKDVVDEMKVSIHSFVPLSIHPSHHPSMDGITAAHVVKILLYSQKQSHYTAEFYFIFWRNFADWRQKKTQCDLQEGILKKELPEHSLYFLEKEKEKKKEEFARFRQ